MSDKFSLSCVSAIPYTVKVTTGEGEDNGTSSNVWVKILGAKKKHTGRLFLELAQKDKFAPGSVEIFSLEAVDVEEIKKVEVSDSVAWCSFISLSICLFVRPSGHPSSRSSILHPSTQCINSYINPLTHSAVDLSILPHIHTPPPIHHLTGEEAEIYGAARGGDMWWLCD